MWYWIGEWGIVDVGVIGVGVPAESSWVVGGVCQFIESGWVFTFCTLVVDEDEDDGEDDDVDREQNGTKKISSSSLFYWQLLDTCYFDLVGLVGFSSVHFQYLIFIFIHQGQSQHCYSVDFGSGNGNEGRGVKRYSFGGGSDRNRSLLWIFWAGSNCYLGRVLGYQRYCFFGVVQTVASDRRYYAYIEVIQLLILVSVLLLLGSTSILLIAFREVYQLRTGVSESLLHHFTA